VKPSFGLREGSLSVAERSILLVFALWSGTRLAHSQAIGDDEAAMSRAERLCEAMGRDWEAEGTRVGRLASSWRVQNRQSGFIVMLEGATGCCTSYVDLKLSDQVYNRKAAQVRTVQSHDEAWAAGESVLRDAGQWDSSWDRGELKPLGDQPGADDAKDAHSDRYTLEWLKRAEGYGGAYGRATMTLDLVTGRPVGFTVNVSDFELPPRIMPRPDALSAVRRHWIAEKDRLIDAGYGGEAEQWYGWPGTQEERSRLVLQVRQDGTACFGSDYGQRMSDQGKARLCWVFGYKGTELAVDAENGEPFAGGVSKASVDAARANPPRNPYLPPPAGVTESPWTHGPLPTAAIGVTGLILGWCVRGLVARRRK